MGPRAIAVLGLCGVCLAAPADLTLHPDPVVSARAIEGSTPPDPSQGVVYICPMDPDVRSHQAGVCKRCGMTLQAGIPDPVEFHVDLRVIPASPAPRDPAVLQFLIHDPWKDRPVQSFNVVHERFFHTFVVSEDLEFFEHGHPRFVANGVFQYLIAFPKPGMYRVLSDFYPAGATPQLTAGSVVVPGAPPQAPHLVRDYSPKSARNLRVSLATIPEQPTAGNRTQLRFVVQGAHPLEKYLGAWGHLLAASDDLIDMLHEHPFLADGGPQVEFEIVFPRPGVYRIWAQFQSEGTVNTARFDIPVADVPAS